MNLDVQRFRHQSCRRVIGEKPIRLQFQRQSQRLGFTAVQQTGTLPFRSPSSGGWRYRLNTGPFWRQFGNQRAQFGGDGGRQKTFSNERKQMQRARLVQMQDWAGVRDDSFHFAVGFSFKAQAMTFNCCCSINSNRRREMNSRTATRTTSVAFSNWPAAMKRI